MLTAASPTASHSKNKYWIKEHFSPLTFAVLAASAARGVAVTGKLVVRRRLAGEGMCWVWLIGEGVHHGPRGSPRERQGGQGVLVRGAAGTIVVIQRQIGHICVGDTRERVNNGAKMFLQDLQLTENNF